VTSGDPVTHRPTLQGWPGLGGYDPSPPSIEDAEAAFQRGVDAHARGAHAEAQAEFLRAAALIPDDAPNVYAASLNELRRIARQNAEISAAASGG
jgi:hypothetical protein